jgi:hypothetical protein
MPYRLLKGTSACERGDFPSNDERLKYLVFDYSLIFLSLSSFTHLFKRINLKLILKIKVATVARKCFINDIEQPEIVSDFNE